MEVSHRPLFVSILKLLSHGDEKNQSVSRSRKDVSSNWGWTHDLGMVVVAHVGGCQAGVEMTQGDGECGWEA